MNLFDIVIPVGPNDADVIERQLTFTKQNIIGYRNIYLICYDPTITFEGCITIDEQIFPFSKDTIHILNPTIKTSRIGWYLQQLLKLYSGTVIPDILDRYLAIDSDTFFLKPTTFVENNKCLYSFGSEYNPSYFTHMASLHELFVKKFPDISGICHHMIFETAYVTELISMVETKHNKVFHEVFIESVTVNTYPYSGASEYELYFNYIVENHADKIKIRELRTSNVSNAGFKDLDYDHVSYHYYMRS